MNDKTAASKIRELLAHPEVFENKQDELRALWSYVVCKRIRTHRSPWTRALHAELNAAQKAILALLAVA